MVTSPPVWTAIGWPAEALFSAVPAALCAAAVASSLSASFQVLVAASR
jgi:hypothetical protein